MEPILLDVPEEVSTERLILRRARLGDSGIIQPAIIESGAELAPWMPWAMPTPEISSTELWVRRSVSKFVTREQLDYLIFLGHTDDYLGTASLLRIDWKVPKAEIGYWLRTTQCRKGYMTEAAGALTRIGFDKLKMARIEIRCDEENARSRRVAELSGFTLEGVLRNEVRDAERLRNTCVYAMIQQAS